MSLPDADFLFDLLDTPSPTGFEAPGQRVWAGFVRPHAEAVESDAYGNVWATRPGSGPKLLLEAHADEIGFMIKHVTDEGLLYVDRVGGSDAAAARGRRLRILGSKGEVRGVIGNTAIHLRDRNGDEKAPKVEELYVDVGAKNRDEVAALGLRVGHPMVYADGPEWLGEARLVGRALDNRLGSYVTAQVLKSLAETPASADVTVLNAIQEEIGGHGARMAAYHLRPDVAVVLDVTHATDTPGIPKTKHGEVKLGGGPTVTHGTVNHPKVVERLVAVAEAEGIAIQHESSSRFSGTDTDVIFHSRRGIPSALVSIPLRYMHSAVETVAVSDVEATIRLLTAFARSITTDDSFAADVL